jgi:hypothetical protein
MQNEANLSLFSSLSLSFSLVSPLSAKRCWKKMKKTIFVGVSSQFGSSTFGQTCDSISNPDSPLRVGYKKARSKCSHKLQTAFFVVNQKVHQTRDSLWKLFINNDSKGRERNEYQNPKHNYVTLKKCRGTGNHHLTPQNRCMRFLSDVFFALTMSDSP